MHCCAYMPFLSDGESTWHSSNYQCTSRHPTKATPTIGSRFQKRSLNRGKSICLQLRRRSSLPSPLTRSCSGDAVRGLWSERLLMMFTHSTLVSPFEFKLVLNVFWRVLRVF